MSNRSEPRNPATFTPIWMSVAGWIAKAYVIALVIGGIVGRVILRFTPPTSTQGATPGSIQSYSGTLHWKKKFSHPERKTVAAVRIMIHL